ncbi:MAG: chemotaxis protein CheA [Gemmatimonadota bacterium]|nr:chemotaxis protein CheA [Gemmatimonadota bacterium]
MDLSRYVDLFLSEGREHVAELSGALSELDRDSQSASAIAAAFRAVHSVKGMAAAMGYIGVTERANALETTLDSVRRAQGRVTPPLLSHLLEESDALAHDIEVAAGTGVPSDDGPPTATTPKRAAPTHVRVRATRLDALMDLVGEIEIERGRVARELERVSDERLTAAFAAASRLLSELREQVIAARMVPAGQIFDRFPQLVRETARSLGKDVEFTLDGADIELDRSILDRIGDPVMHLLRNALDHGIESAPARAASGKSPRGRLTLSAQREAGYVLIRVADDGGGIDRHRVLARAVEAGLIPSDVSRLGDAELLAVLVHPGFSTATEVTSVSGRGVGLDAVDSTVSALGGAIEIKSVEGRGTAITLRLPLSVAIVRALVARVGDELFAIPFTHVVETVEIEPPAYALRGGDWRELDLGGELTRVLVLRKLFGMPPAMSERMVGVCVHSRGQRATLIVDQFVGQQDVVVKRFDPPRDGALIFAGATVLGDGSPALIVDVNSLV